VHTTLAHRLDCVELEWDISQDNQDFDSGGYSDLRAEAEDKVWGCRMYDAPTIVMDQPILVSV
jgi:hypothetical protein